MDELTVRAIVVLAVAGAAVLIARRPAPTESSWPAGVLEGPAIVFFSSRTCSSCEEARAVLDEVAAGRYREIGWEDDPDRWVDFGVDSVPAVVLVDRRGVVAQDMLGQPDAARLRRWLRRI